MAVLVLTVWKAIKAFVFITTIISGIAGVLQTRTLWTQLQEHARYQGAVAAAQVSNDPNIMAAIPTVSAPDIVQWMTTVGPILLAVASFVTTSVLNRPDLNEWVKKIAALLSAGKPLLDALPKPVNQVVTVPASIPATVPLPVDPDLDHIADAVVQSDPKAASLWVSLQALCDNTPPGGKLTFDYETPEGLKISIWRVRGEAVVA